MYRSLHFVCCGLLTFHLLANVPFRFCCFICKSPCRLFYIFLLINAPYVMAMLNSYSGGSVELVMNFVNWIMISILFTTAARSSICSVGKANHLAGQGLISAETCMSCWGDRIGIRKDI